MSEPVLVLCAGCERHVRSTEQRCPFCDHLQPEREYWAVSVSRSSRAGLMAIGAALAAACTRPSGGDTQSSPRVATVAEDAGGAQVVVVPLDAQVFDAMVDAGALEPDGVSLADARVEGVGDAARIARRGRRDGGDDQGALLAALHSQQPQPSLLQGIGVAAYGLSPSPGTSAYGGPGIDPGLGSPTPTPDVSVSVVSVRGDDSGSVTRALRQRIPMFRACYIREVRANPSLSARAVLRFHVSDEGRVVDPAVTGLDAAPTFAACVRARLGILRFEPPSNAAQEFIANLQFQPGR
jgi:hypothetical protein